MQPPRRGVEKGQVSVAIKFSQTHHGRVEFLRSVNIADRQRDLPDLAQVEKHVRRPPDLAPPSKRLGQALQFMLRCVALQRITFNRMDQKQMDETLPDLGDLERDVMQLVWAQGPITAEVVREQLPRRLKESTVRTVLRRLEEKGYVGHTVEGRTYVYQATEARGRVAARAVQRIVDWFCNGSVDEVLVGMVDTAMLDRKRLRMLTDRMSQTKSGKK